MHIQFFFSVNLFRLTQHVCTEQAHAIFYSYEKAPEVLRGRRLFVCMWEWWSSRDMHERQHIAVQVQLMCGIGSICGSISRLLNLCNISKILVRKL